MRDSCGISGTGETSMAQSAEKAHRTPRGKRASWNGNQQLSRATKFKLFQKMRENYNFFRFLYRNPNNKTSSIAHAAIAA
jgi:hypothetical protein